MAISAKKCRTEWVSASFGFESPVNRRFATARETFNVASKALAVFAPDGTEHAGQVHLTETYYEKYSSYGIDAIAPLVPHFGAFVRSVPD
jgi:hypothetical protein